MMDPVEVSHTDESSAAEVDSSASSGPSAASAAAPAGSAAPVQDEEFDDDLPIKITVGDPEQRGGTLRGFLAYPISVTPSISGVSSVFRRYSEFAWFRDVVSRYFAGLYIPPLPPKKLGSRFDADFLEARRLGLQRFMNRVARLPMIAASKLWETFLSRPSEAFTASMGELERVYTLSPGELAEQVAGRFPEAAEAADDDAVKRSEDFLRLKEFLARSEAQLDALTSASQDLVKRADATAEEAGTFAETLGALARVERDFPSEPSLARLDVVTQFDAWAATCAAEARDYREHLLKQIDRELEDLRAFIELTQYRDALEVKFAKAKAKADKWRSAEAGGAAGSGSTLTDKMVAQKKEDYELEQGLEKLLEIITKVILGSQIQTLWAQKISSFRTTILQFATKQLQSSSKMAGIWESVSASGEAQQRQQEQQEQQQ